MIRKDVGFVFIMIANAEKKVGCRENNRKRNLGIYLHYSLEKVLKTLSAQII